MALLVKNMLVPYEWRVQWSDGVVWYPLLINADTQWSSVSSNGQNGSGNWSIEGDVLFLNRKAPLGPMLIKSQNNQLLIELPINGKVFSSGVLSQVRKR